MTYFAGVALLALVGGLSIWALRLAVGSDHRNSGPVSTPADVQASAPPLADADAATGPARLSFETVREGSGNLYRGTIEGISASPDRPGAAGSWPAVAGDPSLPLTVTVTVPPQAGGQNPAGAGIADAPPGAALPAPPVPAGTLTLSPPPAAGLGVRVTHRDGLFVQAVHIDLSRVDRPFNLTLLRRMRVTAYCPCELCCGRWADGITASGEPVTADGGRFVAADPAVIPLGRRVVVPGYADGQPVRVLDTGGAIKGRRLDVFFSTHREALAWGVKELDVVVIESE